MLGIAAACLTSTEQQQIFPEKEKKTAGKESGKNCIR
jgi:hypothetical protein